MRVLTWAAAGVVFVAVAMLGLSIYTCYALRSDMLLAVLVADEGPANPAVRLLEPLNHRVYLWRLEHQDAFPDRDYAPNSAIGAAVATFEDLPQQIALERHVVQLMQARGADINAYDCLGFTPLHGAVLANRPQSVAMLLELGAKPDLPVRPRSTCDGLLPAAAARPYEGLDALGFAQWFADNRREARGEVIGLLQARKKG